MIGHALGISSMKSSPWRSATGLSCHPSLSCYIAGMMPSPVTYWLQKIAATCLLLASILLLPLIPARHVLLPLWPNFVEEVLINVSDQASAARHFVPAGVQEWDPSAEIARSRPFHLVVVQLSDGRELSGFPVGTRTGPQADLDIPLPPAMMAMWVEKPEAIASELILLDAGQQIVSLPMSEIVRLYRPNQLSLVQRAAMTAKRLMPAWMQRR